MEAKERILRNENENRILKVFMVFGKKNWKIKFGHFLQYSFV